MSESNGVHRRMRTAIGELVVALVSNLLLVFIPIPIGPLRRRLVGCRRQRGDGRDTVFFCHPDIVCTAHLIWIGWLVAAAGAYDVVTAEYQWWVVPMQPLYWLWVTILVLTIVVLGLRFSVVSCGFLGGGILLALTTALLIQRRVETPFLGEFYEVVENIPLQIAWGVPMIVSLVLGLVLATVAAWQSMNDVWVLPHDEDFIERYRFLRKSSSISMDRLNFEANFPCLIRHFLFFGYGNVRIWAPDGREADTIEGVFFAGWHASQMRKRVTTVGRSGSNGSHPASTAAPAGTPVIPPHSGVVVKPAASDHVTTGGRV